MKSVNDVYESVVSQQLHMLIHIKNTIYQSGNLNGIPQWRDRKRLHKVIEKVYDTDYLLTKKDFQFLDSLYQKYKN
jgi:hypothetical protein